ncbi:MAG: hypothetical protein MZV70_01350 [Desulfobacterales bacterium]|nr:hypothetical protein [Desulfobacterales bacterium]
MLDWDGKVVATVYLQGCNWRPRLLPQRRAGAAHLQPGGGAVHLSIEEYVHSNSEFLDGVVITGGEPTLHDDLPALIRRFRKMGMKVKLDTNGSRPEMLSDLIGSGFPGLRGHGHQGPLEREVLRGRQGRTWTCLRSSAPLALIMDHVRDYEFRTTVVPFYLDTKDIEAIASFIGGAKKYALHQFGNRSTLDPRLGVMDPYPDAKVMEMAERARQYVRKVVVRGTSRPYSVFG